MHVKTFEPIKSHFAKVYIDLEDDEDCDEDYEEDYDEDCDEGYNFKLN